MRDQTTIHYKIPPRDPDLRFTHNIETAGWLLSVEKAENLEQIRLGITEEGKTFAACFFKCADHERTDFDQMLDYKHEHPEEFRKTVKAGLEKLNAYLNGFLREKQNRSALNRKEARK